MATIQTKDMVLLELDTKTCKKISVISDMIQDLGSLNETVPISNVDSDVFHYIIQLLHIHESRGVYDELWQRISFIDMVRTSNAIYFLGINCLMDVICDRIIQMIDGMSQDQVNENFI